MFYLKDMLTVDRGDVVEGSIAIRPNEKNHRDLDIDVEYRLDGELPAEAKLSYKMSAPPCSHSVRPSTG